MRVLVGLADEHDAEVGAYGEGFREEGEDLVGGGGGGDVEVLGGEAEEEVADAAAGVEGLVAGVAEGAGGREGGAVVRVLGQVLICVGESRKQQQLQGQMQVSRLRFAPVEMTSFGWRKGHRISEQGRSAELLGLGPDLGPGTAEVMADQDVGVVHGFFVADAVGDVDLPSDLAAFEVLSWLERVSPVTMTVFGLVRAKAALVEAVGAGDGCGQVVLRAVEGDGARFTVVVGENAEAGKIFGREGVADVGYVGDELGPADLVGEIGGVGELAGEGGGSGVVDGKEGRGDQRGVGEHAGEGKRCGGDAYGRGSRSEGSLEGDGSGGEEDGVGGEEVVSAAFGQGEEDEGPDVDGGENTQAGIAEQGDQSRDGEGQGQQGVLELVGIEAVGAAVADVADVDEVLHLEGDEAVARQPDEVGGSDHERL